MLSRIKVLPILGIKKKTPEEKRKERIENKCHRLINELEIEYHDLSIEEQVEAIVMFNKVFKKGKEEELKKLTERQLEIAKAIKVLKSIA